LFTCFTYSAKKVSKALAALTFMTAVFLPGTHQFAVRPRKWAPANAISIAYSPKARPHSELTLSGGKKFRAPRNVLA
jgi:hypothetical protein